VGSEQSPEETLERVRAFLKREGYPLEYEAARTLSRAGFNTEQGLTYIDSEDGKSVTREIDVVAWLHESVRARFRALVGLIVECKAAREPWLVLTRHDDDAGWLEPRSLVMSDRFGKVFDASSLHAPAWKVQPRHGFGLVQVKRGNERRDKDPAYVALVSVVKATDGYLSRLHARKQSAYGAVLIPVLVTAGPLFQLGLREDGTEVLEPVVWQRLLWNGSTVRAASTVVDVVTRNHLPQYALMMVDGARRLLERMSRLPGEPPSSQGF
jgi:hypothetical protein